MTIAPYCENSVRVRSCQAGEGWRKGEGERTEKRDIFRLPECPSETQSICWTDLGPQLPWVGAETSELQSDPQLSGNDEQACQKRGRAPFQKDHQVQCPGCPQGLGISSLPQAVRWRMDRSSGDEHIGRQVSPHLEGLESLESAGAAATKTSDDGTLPLADEVTGPFRAKPGPASDATMAPICHHLNFRKTERLACRRACRHCILSR